MFYFITETPQSLKVTDVNCSSQKALQLWQNWLLTRQRSQHQACLKFLIQQSKE